MVTHVVFSFTKWNHSNESPYCPSMRVSEFPNWERMVRVVGGENWMPSVKSNLHADNSIEGAENLIYRTGDKNIPGWWVPGTNIRRPIRRDSEHGQKKSGPYLMDGDEGCCMCRHRICIHTGAGPVERDREGGSAKQNHRRSRRSTFCIWKQSENYDNLIWAAIFPGLSLVKWQMDIFWELI